MPELKDYEKVGHNNLWHLRKAVQLLDSTGQEKVYCDYMFNKFGWERTHG